MRTDQVNRDDDGRNEVAQRASCEHQQTRKVLIAKPVRGMVRGIINRSRCEDEEHCEQADQFSGQQESWNSLPPR